MKGDEKNKKYTLVMPETGECPIQKTPEEIVVHLPSEKHSGMVFEKKVNTIHPLESSIAEFDATAKGYSSESKVVHIGVCFIKWLHLMAIAAITPVIFEFKEESIGFFFFLVLQLLVVVYFVFKYMSKILSPNMRLDEFILGNHPIVTILIFALMLYAFNALPSPDY